MICSKKLQEQMVQKNLLPMTIIFKKKTAIDIIITNGVIFLWFKEINSILGFYSNRSQEDQYIRLIGTDFGGFLTHYYGDWYDW